MAFSKAARCASCFWVLKDSLFCLKISLMEFNGKRPSSCTDRNLFVTLSLAACEIGENPPANFRQQRQVSWIRNSLHRHSRGQLHRFGKELLQSSRISHHVIESVTNNLHERLALGERGDLDALLAENLARTAEHINGAQRHRN